MKKKKQENEKFNCLLFFQYSCISPPEEEKSLESQVQIEKTSDIEENLEQAKTVIYSLPSPIETSMLLKHANVSYDESFLNPTNNVTNYNTIKRKALNLGVYSANLSYTSIFGQQQISINYMMAIKKIGEGLDIMEFVDESTRYRLEDNFNDRDSVLNILSETFMKSNAILSESRSTALTALVLYGGWIEGLYIATQLANNSSTLNRILIDRISDQGLSLSIVISLLEDNNGNKDVEAVLIDAEKLNLIFNSFIDVQKSNNDNNQDYYELLEPHLKELITTTSIIRNKYTN
ncbi:MAG: hypothetical protein U9R19_00235 [Bacteroidota bacterium]|nr:hypothetical protein [Bacteroidota bacterium]